MDSTIRHDSYHQQSDNQPVHQGPHLPIRPIGMEVEQPGVGGNELITDRQRAIAQGKRTPSNIEALLRRYNNEGLTKWKLILERLKNENPSIELKRSTLGEYLKECNLGTSRRKNMEDDEMRQLVISELDRTQNKKRGVRKVWNSLKSNGHHIKRDFVEKIMKEVDPGGFSQRRPKWKTLPELSHAVISVPPPQSFPADSAYLQTTTQTTENGSPSRSLNNATTAPYGLPQDQNIPLPAHTSQVNGQGNSQGPGPDVPPAPSFTTDITTTIQHSHGARMDEGQEFHPEQRHFSSIEAVTDPHDISMIQPPPGSLTSIGQASVEKDAHDGESLSDEVSVAETDHESVDEAPSDERRPSPPLKRFLWNEPPIKTQEQVFWEAMATADTVEQRRQIQRLQLKNTIEDILVELDEWCIKPLQDTPPAPSTPSEFPVSATRDASINPEQGHLSGASFDSESRHYIPDYDVPEDRVTEDALFLALELKRMLVHPKSRSSILHVTTQLWQVRGRLEDIGMPESFQSEVSLRHLDVVEMVSDAYAGAEWALRDILLCAADYLTTRPEELLKDNEYERVAEEAAAAARKLISLRSIHSDFYRASSLHYSSCGLWPRDDHIIGLILEQFLDLFEQCVPPDPPLEYVREMLRTIESFRIRWTPKPEVKGLCHLLVISTDTVSCHPALAALFVRIWEDMLYSFPPGVFEDHLIENALSAVVERLRSSQDARPSCVQSILPRALLCHARVLWLSHRRSEAIQMVEDALIRRMPIRFGDEQADNYLSLAMKDYIGKQLSLQHWDDSLDTMHRLMDLVMASSSSRVMFVLCDALGSFSSYCRGTRDPRALIIMRRLVDSFRPIIGSHCPHELLEVLGTCMQRISQMERGLGNFEAALGTSREALTIARHVWLGPNESDHSTIKGYIAALACHTRSLVDTDAYEEAVLHLQEAKSLWESSRSRYKGDQWAWVDNFAQFGLLHAYCHPTMDFLSNVNENLAGSSSWPTRNMPPYWLSSPYYCCWVDSIDVRGWLRLIQTAVLWTASPISALTSAHESLSLMDKYHKAHGENLEPYAKASVLGHKYILLCLIGIHGQDVLGQTITLYRSVLTAAPHLARLPLLVSLEILLIISRGNPRFDSVTPRLREWKKSVYKGRTSFFEEFVSFLWNLSDYIRPTNSAFDSSAFPRLTNDQIRPMS